MAAIEMFAFLDASQVLSSLTMMRTGFTYLYTGSLQRQNELNQGFLDFNKNIQKWMPTLQYYQANYQAGLDKMKNSLLFVAGASGLALGGMALGYTKVLTAIAPFEMSMSRLRIIAGLSNDQFENINKTILQTAIRFGLSSDEIAAATVEMAKAGLNAVQILESIVPTAALATNSNIKMAEAMDNAKSLMKAFGLQTSELTTIMDYMYVVANSATINVEDFANGIKQGGAVAAMAGVSYQDFLRLIAFYSDVSIKAQTAGRGLVDIITDLLMMMKDTSAIEKFESALGINVDMFADGKFNVLGLIEALSQSEGSLERLSTVFDTFDKMGGKAFTLLFKNADKFLELYKKTQDVQNANITAADRLSQTIERQITSLKEMFMETFKAASVQKMFRNSLNDLKISLEAVIPIMSESLMMLFISFAKMLKEIGPMLKSLAEAFKNTLPTIIAFAEVGLKMLGFLVGLVNIFPILLPMMYTWKFISAGLGLIQAGLAKIMEIQLITAIMKQTLKLQLNTAAQLQNNISKTFAYAMTGIGIAVIVAAIGVTIWMTAEIRKQTDEIKKNMDTQNKLYDANSESYSMTQSMITANRDLTKSYNEINRAVTDALPNLQDYIDAYLILTKESRTLTYTIAGGGPAVGTPVAGGNYYYTRIDQINAEGETVQKIQDELNNLPRGEY